MNMIKNVMTKVAAGTAFAMAAVGSAYAALPAAIDTELASVQTDGLALADKVWPVVITLFGAALLIKLFKRFAAKI